jgi:lysophospholipase L1-like esterase
MTYKCPSPTGLGIRVKTILRVLLSILISITPILILFALLEFIFRHVETKNARELPRHGENGSYVPVRMKGGYRGNIAGVPVALNRYGMRDEPDFSPIPPSGEYRILSMGDSIAFGVGIKSRDTYAKVLERRLNEKGGTPHYYVINAAGPGTSPSCYYVALKNESLQWHPHMVLMEMELTNDVTDEALQRWETEPDNPNVPKAVRGGRYVVSWDGMVLSSYIRGPYFYEETYTYIELSRRFLNLLYQLTPNKPYPANPSVCYYTLQHEWYLLNQRRIEDGWDRLFRALCATRDLLKQRNIAFLLMIMPSRFVFDPDSNDHQNVFAQGLLARAVQFATKNGIAFIDFTDCIRARGGAGVYLDTVHPNAEGNLAIGSALFEHITKKNGTE